MSRTTTANFADFAVYPSRLSVAALTIFYLGAAGGLLLAWGRGALPVPLFLIGCELLWLEWIGRYHAVYRHQGRLILKAPDRLFWQQRWWSLSRIKVHTRYLMLIELRQATRRRWLLICHDACDVSGYRALSLLCHHLNRIK
ncbi:protein YgfX [Photobacterium sp. TY1-4]|uniref:protein YgfX n=1 Tax=Photobacterium sp. TY1-4 TaxID=2899122 RepID=UPI0021BF82BB|nr:protein YgfX [Photobacterium sp. TY1-4]UXI01738.1 protein YgfX [Photobacterium sp. TY1-4]